MQPADDLTQQGADLVTRVKQLHEDVQHFMLSVKSKLAAGTAKQPQLADWAWALYQLHKYSEDIRKDAWVQQQQVGKVLCAVWITMSSVDPELPDQIIGEIAQVTPHVGLGANAPERDTEEWRLLMDHLGIPVGARHLVKLKWNKLCELLDARAAEGAQLPPGVPADKTYNVYGLRNIRLKKGVQI